MSDMSGEFLESVLAEQASEPESETTSEQLAEIEGQAEPFRVREGRWRTRGEQEVRVTAMPTDHDDFSPAYPWWDGDVTTWSNDGVFFSGQTAAKDLVTYLGPIEPGKTQERNAAAIDELRSEVSYLQNLLGTRTRRVVELETLVASLRTINTALEQAVERANNANDDLQNRLTAVAAEWAQAAQQAARNDKLAQLEVLQPMAAACSTAQTMVRDMLGHMRCLLALHHTTDRSNFCTLLESILEVFDDVECDDDGYQTSEAEQG